jgi:hypothetical protein
VYGSNSGEYYTQAPRGVITGVKVTHAAAFLVGVGLQLGAQSVAVRLGCSGEGGRGFSVEEVR